MSSNGKLILNISFLYYRSDRQSLNQQFTLGAYHTQNVRSKDRVDIGNVISESSETFTVMQGACREYNIPKSAVEAFDGSEP